MVIFHSYLKIPEGNPHETTIFWPQNKWRLRRRVRLDAQVSVSKTRQNVRFEVWSVSNPADTQKKPVVLES